MSTSTTPVSRVSLATLNPDIPFVPAVALALAKAARETVGDNPSTDHFTRAARAYADHPSEDDHDTILALWKDVIDAARRVATLLPDYQATSGIGRETPYVETEIVLAANAKNRERVRLLLQSMTSAELRDYRKSLQYVTEQAGRILKHRQEANGG